MFLWGYSSRERLQLSKQAHISSAYCQEEQFITERTGQISFILNLILEETCALQCAKFYEGKGKQERDLFRGEWSATKLWIQLGKKSESSLLVWEQELSLALNNYIPKLERMKVERGFRVIVVVGSLKVDIILSWLVSNVFT